MSSRLVKLVLSVPILAALASPVLANLLVNPGAETGTTDGWTPDGAQIYTTALQEQTSGDVTPQSGSYFFSWAGSPGTYQELVQSAVDPEMGGMVLELTGWVQTENLAGDDFGTAKLEVLDEFGSVLAASTTNSLTSPSLIWEPFGLTLTAPANAVSWRVTLSGTRLFGSFINVFFDSLSLTKTQGTSTVRIPVLTDDLRLENHPNPFNPSTTIVFTLPKDDEVTLSVYELSGRFVRTLCEGLQVAAEREYAFAWNGTDASGRAAASGTYLYRLRGSSGLAAAGRMTLVK